VGILAYISVNVTDLIDTNSSDLWVTGNIPNAQDSGVAATISYAVGQAGGDINFATMKFDDYTVEKQAFCESHRPKMSATMVTYIST
jgi:hypothetical protein